MIHVFRKMWSETKRSSQLRWTLLSVAVNLMLTLALWVLVYRMEVNSELSQLYFFDSQHDSTTGNLYLDGLVNGLFTVIVLGIVSFIMLAFVVYDFKKVVKCWLIFSCILILFGVSGQTFYDSATRLFDQDTENGQYFTLVCTILPTLVYGLTGIVAFLDEGHLLLHQFYVISNCSLISVFYLRAFPSHTTWFVLFTVLFWDLFAVMNPMGPLKRVQEKASDYSNNVLKFLMFAADEKRQMTGADIIAEGEVENEERSMRRGVRELIERYAKKEARDEELVQKIRQRRAAWNPESDTTEHSPFVESETSPVLPEKDKNSDREESDDDVINTAESSTLTSSLSSEGNLSVTTADEGDPSVWLPWLEEQERESMEMRAQNEPLTAADALNDGETVRLGFGDFVFYSLLIGQTATGGCPIAVFFAAFGIVFGLVLTLTVLSSDESTTPALPLPIICGTACYFFAKFAWESLMFA